jgi:hypothetical protein
LGAIIAAPALYQFRLHPFPIDSEGHKNDFAFEAADAGASEGDVMYVQFDNPTWCGKRP